MGSISQWIAWRYLRSKKSHSAVSVIAFVSIAGVAIATAAVVCILSVFNGFKTVLGERYDTLAPDIVITPATGKVIESPDSIIQILQDLPEVKALIPVVTDKALAVYDGHELPVTIKGVDTDIWDANTGIASVIFPGGTVPVSGYKEMPEFETYEEYEEFMANVETPEVLASIGASVRLGNLIEGDRFLLFAPRREGRYNPANPAASFVADSVKVSGIYETRQREYDEDLVIVPINLARHLFQYEDEVSAIEIALKDDVPQKNTVATINSILGSKFNLTDRARQQEINFRMVNIEKWVSFLLLAFILMIAGFNIISTMTMLVLEKKRQIRIFRAIGISKKGIGSVFANESIMVSLIGGLAGIAIGVLLCWLQQEFGLVKLAGDPSKLIMKAYPVKLIWSDVILSFAPCLVLGLITAFISSAFSAQRASFKQGDSGV